MDLLKRWLRFARQNLENTVLAKTTVILLYTHIHLQTLAGHYGFLKRPGSRAVVFVSNTFMSSCVICVVIAREIFLLQSDCPEITKVHNKFKNNNKNGNLTFKCCSWPVGVCSVPSECLSAKICCSWSSDKFAKRATCEFFLIRLCFCCLLDQDLKGQCRSKN